MDNYDQASTIVDMHKAPRFGHSSEIAKAASIEPGERSDYFIGVGSFTFLVLFFFVLWGIILLMLALAGTRRAGWASGRIHTANKKGLHGAVQLKRRLQFIFIICCLIVFVGCGTLLHKGLEAVRIAVVDMKELNQDIGNLIYEGMNIATSALRVQTSFNSDKIQPLIEANKFCYKSSNDPVGKDHYLGLTLDGLMDEFDTIGAYINENVSEVNEDLLSLRDSSDEVDNYFSWFQQNDWLVKMYVLILGVITFFMFSMTLFSTCNLSTPPLRFMTSVFFFPVFTVLLVVTLLGSCVLAFVTIMNADFCSGGEYPGSPEGTIEDALIYSGFNEEDLFYRSFSYYKEGCLAENPIKVMYGYENNLQNMLTLADDFLNQTNHIGLETLNGTCVVDASQVLGAAKILKLNTATALENLERIFEYSSCSKISPFYRRVFNGATCKESVVGLTWMFASLVIICSAGLMMVSFRAGMFRILMGRRQNDTSTINEQEEYEEYIRQFYDSSSEHGNDGKPENILPAASFDTEITTKQSMDYSDDDYDNDYDSHVVDLESVYNTPSRMQGGFREEETLPLSPPLRRPISATRDVKDNINGNEEILSLPPPLKPPLLNSISHDEETLPLSPTLNQPGSANEMNCDEETLPLSPALNQLGSANKIAFNEETLPLSPTLNQLGSANKMAYDDQSTGSI